MKTTSQLLRHLAPLLGAATFLFTAWAQNQATLTPVGKWPEYPLPGGGRAVRVAGSYAYVADQAGPHPLQGSAEKATLRLSALDVSTPSQPRYLSHVDTLTDFDGYMGWSASSMQIRGAYAYVALGSIEPPEVSMLAVYSLSQPALPRLISTLTLPLTGCASGIDVVGDHAYVSAYSVLPRGGWLLVIHVSDPAHPSLETTVHSEVLSECVSVAGNYAYLGGTGGTPGETIGRVDIIDISDPGQAVVVGSFDMLGYNTVMGIKAEGSLLHCSSINWASRNRYDVFDRTDPLNPAPIGGCEYELGWGSIRVMGSLVFLASNAGLHIIDVMDPQNPWVRGRVNLGAAGWDSQNFDVAGQLAYWCGDCLRVLDVKDPAAPFQIGQFDIGFGAPLISTEGGLAYLLDGQRLRVLNVSNPRAPALVGAKDLAYAGPFKVVGSYGYVAAGSFLQILDLRNPSQPVEAGRFDGGFTGFDVVGNRAYLTVGGDKYTGWLKVIDISNPAVPVELGSLYTSDDSPYLVQVVGDYAYVRLYDTHLAIVDIRDPSSMVRVGGYHPNGFFDEFQVVGRYAYFPVHSESEQSIHVVDLADPTQPTRVGRLLYDPGTVSLSGLFVSGAYAFVTFSHRFTQERHLDILDVRDPTQPVKVGEYDPQPRTEYLDMVMAGNTLYTATQAGLTVLDFFALNVSPRLRLNAPVLSGGVAVLTWEGGPGIKLQKTTSLTTPNWQDVPNTDGQSLSVLPQTDAAAFFRLIQP